MAMGRSRTATGRAGEEAAAQYLTQLGYRVLARNVRFRAGEIDLVAQHDGYLVFVEVKTRFRDGYGSGAEAVTRAKQRQLVRLATVYLAGLPGGFDRSARFDVVEVVPATSNSGWACTVIANAFDAS